MNLVNGSFSHLVIDWRTWYRTCVHAGMSIESDRLKERAMSFAVGILRLVDRFPRTPGAQVVARQLAKSATSVGAHYVAGCSARSRAEFIAKLSMVNEEADESVFWLELTTRAEYIPRTEAEPHRQEAIELRAIFGRSVRTARLNERSQKADTRMAVTTKSATNQ